MKATINFRHICLVSELCEKLVGQFIKQFVFKHKPETFSRVCLRFETARLPLECYRSANAVLFWAVMF